MKRKLKRGDVVEYRAAGVAGMEQWTVLDGRIGVVESGPISDTFQSGNTGYTVQWINHALPPPADDFTKPYAEELLTKIGEIELPPDPHV